ncbi:hypothetical protein KEM52_004084, partial [Ascosphaera acerosa]
PGPPPRRHGSLSSAYHPSRLERGGGAHRPHPHAPPPYHPAAARRAPDYYLSDLPALIPGGKLRPSSLDAHLERRLAQLEHDRARLQAQVEEKQKAKRARLREWERLCRESAAGALRSELAETQLQSLTEGAGISGASELGRVAF